MTEAAVKHFPRPTPETETYWEGCRKHQLLLQRCTQCEEFQFYPRGLCSKCISEDLEWEQASGKGQILTFTIVRRAVSAAYDADVPYVVALIRLDEGPTIMSNIVECDPEALQIGDPVQVLFEDWSDEISIPKFSPVKSST
jgi:uncharacterized OB-fold protein